MDAFDHLSDLVENTCIERGDKLALGEWSKVVRVYREELPQLREDSQALKGLEQKYNEPPLQHAIYLGPSQGDKQYLVVGLGGIRIEVRDLPDMGISAETLVPGQLVVLNKAQSLVDIRYAYVCGETAEVVNVLREDEEAEVLFVIRDAEQQPTKLRVRWRENEEIEVTCSTDLAATNVRRGSIVRIDPDQKVAIARAKPRLHVKRGGNEGTVVEISDTLAAQDVQIGDIVRIEEGLKFAFEKLPAYETGKLALEDVPDITYEDVGGLEEQISHIYDAIELPYIYREQFENYHLVRPKGILLYGPPGCGKTMVAKAVANSLTLNIRNHLSTLERVILLYKNYQQTPNDPALLTEYRAWRANEHRPLSLEDILRDLASYLRQHDIDLETIDDELRKLRALFPSVRSFFLNVKGPELLDKYVGETEHRIRKIFEEARQHSSYYTPVVIFFDEMEAMFRIRGSGRSSDIETTIVPQFLSEIDGVEGIENLIIIGASNRQDMIDPAILRPGRLDVKIKIGRPARKSAQDIFAMYLLPTLPFSTEELTLPADFTDLDGTVIFRTAYRPSKAGKHQPESANQSTGLSELLPPGCDARLACSFLHLDQQTFARLPSTATVREALKDIPEDQSLARRLRNLKPDLAISVLIARLDQFSRRYHEDPSFKQTINDLLKQEWIAETLLLQAVDLLYSSVSVVKFLSNEGGRYTFPFEDFISGAIIENIVTRAKRQAIKRVLFDTRAALDGICWNDLREAIRAEFTENQEQFARQKLSDMGKVNENVQWVEIGMDTVEIDPWREEKLHIYTVISPFEQ